MQVVDDQKHHLNNNHIEIPEYMTKLENLYINGSNQIQECVSDQSKQTEEAVGSLVKSEARDLKESFAKQNEDMMAKITDTLSAFKGMFPSHYFQPNLIVLLNQILLQNQ